jgi:hypothetical protein
MPRQVSWSDLWPEMWTNGEMDRGLRELGLRHDMFSSFDDCSEIERVGCNMGALIWVRKVKVR